MTQAAAVQHAESLFDSGAFFNDLARRVAHPTDSQSGTRSAELRAYLSDEITQTLSELGFECALHDNPIAGAPPMLTAQRIEDPALPTVLFYGHGDTVRGHEGQWAEGRNPWALTVAGERWYGRGSADNKSQHSINIAALGCVLKARGGRLGFNAKWLLEMGEEVGSPGLREVCEQHRETLQADIRELTASLGRWEQEGADAQQIERQRARLAGMQADLANMAPPALPEGQLALHAAFFELPPDAPQEADVTAAMLALAQRVNEHNRTALADWAPEPAAAGEPHYVGSAACQSCHNAAYTWWRNHPHGRAYSTLEVRHKQFNLSCVGCHVTGYLQPGGSTVTHSNDGALVNVGCENCHGPASAHVAARASAE